MGIERPRHYLWRFWKRLFHWENSLPILRARKLANGLPSVSGFFQRTNSWYSQLYFRLWIWGRRVFMSRTQQCPKFLFLLCLERKYWQSYLTRVLLSLLIKPNWDVPLLLKKSEAFVESMFFIFTVNNKGVFQVVFGPTFWPTFSLKNLI